MTNEPQEQVIQADREAAAELFEVYSRGLDARSENARKGLIDYSPMVQAFARHRRLHTPEACPHCGAPKHLCDKLEALSSPPIEADCAALAQDALTSKQAFGELLFDYEALVEALRKIEEGCCPLVCSNCRDNRKIAREALARTKAPH